jgi:DNA excision repair protein ERCC-8
LAAKSDGRFTCFDTFQKEGPTSLKTAFTMRNSDDAHSYSISCVQWYPIDSGMFFTSGMDSKFKVWDTNSLQVVDQYDLNHKIYSHNLSILMSSETKTLIALALDNGQVRFVDLNSGSFTHTLKAHPNSYCVCVQWSPYDPNILSSAGYLTRISK